MTIKYANGKASTSLSEKYDSKHSTASGNKWSNPTDRNSPPAKEEVYESSFYIEYIMNTLFVLNAFNLRGRLPTTATRMKKANMHPDLVKAKDSVEFYTSSEWFIIILSKTHLIWK